MPTKKSMGEHPSDELCGTHKSTSPVVQDENPFGNHKLLHIIQNGSPKHSDAPDDYLSESNIVFTNSISICNLPARETRRFAKQSCLTSGRLDHASNGSGLMDQLVSGQPSQSFSSFPSPHRKDVEKASALPYDDVRGRPN